MFRQPIRTRKSNRRSRIKTRSGKTSHRALEDRGKGKGRDKGKDKETRSIRAKVPDAKGRGRPRETKVQGAKTRIRPAREIRTSPAKANAKVRMGRTRRGRVRVREAKATRRKLTRKREIRGQGAKVLAKIQGAKNPTPSDNGNKGRREVVKETPPPALKEVKKANGEIERRAPSGALRERTKVDEKSGVKQTERLAATGRVQTKEVEDKSGTRQITHYDLGREKKAEVIRKDGSKEVTDVHYNRDGKERSREIVKTDVRGKAVSKTVVKNITVNKTVIKTEHHYVAGRYGYVYRPVVVVRPVLFVNPYWYTPAGVVIVHPFHYTWGFHADPWYGYHAHYWEPYPVYYTPSYWVTDWMVAGYVAESYAISTSVAQTREEVRLAREDAAAARAAAEKAQDAAERAEAETARLAAEARADRAEARAAKAELEEAKRKELAGKPNPNATPIDKETKEALQNQVAKTIEEKKKAGDDQVPPDVAAALADPEHIYPVSKKIAGLRAEDDEPAGFLTPGDLLKLKKGQDIPKNADENTFVTMVVMTSKGDDDSVPAGTKIKVAIKDLQEFDNEFRAKLDTGLVEAGKNQDAFKSGAI